MKKRNVSYKPRVFQSIIIIERNLQEAKTEENFTNRPKEFTLYFLMYIY